MAKKIIEVDPYASLRCCTRKEAERITSTAKKNLKGTKLNMKNGTIMYSQTDAEKVEQELYNAAMKHDIKVNIKRNVYIAELPNDNVLVKF